MSVKRLVVSIDPKSVNVTEFCVSHGISRWLFYDLRRRHLVEGDQVLEAKSRAPRRVPNKTSTVVEDLIIELRKSLIDDGWDAGPASIRQHLLDSAEAVRVPSESTIWRILGDRGFITPEPRKRPRPVSHRFERERANELWQIDGTDWTLSNGAIIKIVNVIDDASRTLIGARVHRTESFRAAWDTVCHGANDWGLPEQVLSDNAHAFTTLEMPLSHLGVEKIESRPGHPQTCGKIERFHQTLKLWLAAQPAAATISELQTQVDTFAVLYNTTRKHRAIGRTTPAARWNALAKSGPAKQPINTRSKVHTATADASGRVTAGSQTRITLGTQHAQKQAVTIINTTAAHVFIDGRFVRAIRIRPNQNDYPLYRDNL